VGSNQVAAGNLYKLDLRQILRQPIIRSSRAGGTNTYSVFTGELLESHAFSPDEGNVSQIDQSDVGTYVGVLARRRTNHSVFRFGGDHPRIQWFGHHMLHRLSVSESNVQPEERIA
jgi:hypothetical protein